VQLLDDIASCGVCYHCLIFVRGRNSILNSTLSKLAARDKAFSQGVNRLGSGDYHLCNVILFSTIRDNQIRNLELGEAECNGEVAVWTSRNYTHSSVWYVGRAVLVQDLFSIVQFLLN